MVEIVPLSSVPEHLSVVASWLNAEWGKIRGESETECAALLKSSMDSSICPFVFIAIDSGVPVGTASLLYTDMTTRPELTPWLADLFVVNDRRNSGIGRSLVERVLSHADNLGFKEMFLFSDGNCRLYEDMGWTAMTNEVYRGRDVRVMRYQFRSEDDLTRFQATQILDYVYRLKAEANGRANSIITSNTLFIAALTIAVSLVSRVISALELNSLSFWVFVVAGTIGAILVLVSQLVILSIYHPVVLDSTSEYEPKFIADHSPEQLMRTISSRNTQGHALASLREAHAVSKVEIFRTRRVIVSVWLATGGLIAFVISCGALVLNMFSKVT